MNFVLLTFFVVLQIFHLNIQIIVFNRTLCLPLYWTQTSYFEWNRDNYKNSSNTPRFTYHISGFASKFTRYIHLYITTDHKYKLLLIWRWYTLSFTRIVTLSNQEVNNIWRTSSVYCPYIQAGVHFWGVPCCGLPKDPSGCFEFDDDFETFIWRGMSYCCYYTLLQKPSKK